MAIVDAAGTRQVDAPVAVAVMAPVSAAVPAMMAALVAAPEGIMVLPGDVAILMPAFLALAGDGRTDDRADGETGDDLAGVVTGADLCRGRHRGKRDRAGHEGGGELAEHGSGPFCHCCCVGCRAVTCRSGCADSPATRPVDDRAGRHCPGHRPDIARDSPGNNRAGNRGGADN